MRLAGNDAGEELWGHVDVDVDVQRRVTVNTRLTRRRVEPVRSKVGGAKSDGQKRQPSANEIIV
jgi:hypothetical protein